MNLSELNPLLSNKLIAHKKNFNFLVNLKKNKFPKALLLTGPSGLGKLTFVNHFLNYLHKRSNYNIQNMEINCDSLFYKNVNLKSQENIFYLNLEENEPLKIDQIRNLRLEITKSLINEKERFIIIDRVETLNHNCLNAILKIIEEPSDINNFILINNKTKTLLETIRSRCFEIKVTISEAERLDVINYLKEKYKIEDNFNLFESYLTPGNYISYYNIIKENDLFDKNYLFFIEYLIKLYKKNGRSKYIELIKLKTDLHFSNLILENKKNIDTFLKLKDSISLIINDFLKYNLNAQSVVNSISRKFNNGK